MKMYGAGAHEYKRRDGHRSGEGPKGHYKDYMGEDDELDEDKIQRHQFPRKSGAKVGSDQASPYGSYGGSRYSESRKSKKTTF